MRSSAKPHLPESSAEGSLAANGSAAPLPRAEEQSEGKQAGPGAETSGSFLCSFTLLVHKGHCRPAMGGGAHR